jgi:hypothetical protein
MLRNKQKLLLICVWFQLVLIIFVDAGLDGFGRFSFQIFLVFRIIDFGLKDFLQFLIFIRKFYSGLLEARLFVIFPEFRLRFLNNYLLMDYLF